MVGGPRGHVVVALVLLAALLSGCSSGNKDKASASSTSTSTAATPAVLAVAVVHLPCGTKTAGNASSPSSAGGTKCLSVDSRIRPANGTGDLLVGDKASFDAANSTGAIATYAWSFGDNGTSPNKKAEHAYKAPGKYNVTLTVKGLHNETSNATVQLVVAASKTGTFLFKDHQEFSDSLPVMNPNSCTNQGVDCNDHTVAVVDKDKNGTAAVAHHVWINVTGSSDVPAGDMQVFWKSPDGTTLAETDASGMTFSFDYVGDMPAGDYVLRVRLFTGAQVDYRATVDVVYVQA